MEYVIDAKGRALGRVASEAAAILLAKNTTTVAKNVVANVTVRVKNVNELSISDKKMKQKRYHSHSGYLGNAKSLTLTQVIEKKGHADALSRAVKGMLPTNTLRDKRLKNLIIED